jgi:hypothetical protein
MLIELFSLSFSLRSQQLNPDVNAFQRKFVNEVRRCDEMERKLSESPPLSHVNHEIDVTPHHRIPRKGNQEGCYSNAGYRR